MIAGGGAPRQRSSPDRRQAIARRSEGLARVAANCCLVALSYSPSVEVARAALEEVGAGDVRPAALELLDQLAADAAVTVKEGMR